MKQENKNKYYLIGLIFLLIILNMIDMLITGNTKGFSEKLVLQSMGASLVYLVIGIVSSKIYYRKKDVPKFKEYLTGLKIANLIFCVFWLIGILQYLEGRK